MSKASQIAGAVLIFMFGVIFAYYSYPFFNALLSALDNVSGTPFESWGTIKAIMWIGYAAILGSIILLVPLYKLFVAEEGQ